MKRIQRTRQLAPDSTIYVGNGTLYANPFDLHGGRRDLPGRTIFDRQQIIVQRYAAWLAGECRRFGLPGGSERLQSIRRQAPSIFDSRSGGRTFSISSPASAGERSPPCRIYGDGAPPHQPATPGRADPYLVSVPDFVPIPVAA